MGGSSVVCGGGGLQPPYNLETPLDYEVEEEKKGRVRRKRGEKKR